MHRPTSSAGHAESHPSFKEPQQLMRQRLIKSRSEAIVHTAQGAIVIANDRFYRCLLESTKEPMQSIVDGLS
jgi:hypothetical protein